MSREDRLLYHAIPANRALAAPWIERLEAAGRARAGLSDLGFCANPPS